MDKAYLRSRFPMLMLVFAFGGVFGFIYEAIFYRFDLGEWVKRGTTFGPWIPIYGFGALIILGLTFKFRKNPLLVFLFATIASGVLELVTGWVILKFFGVRLWDYNTEILNWGNINGFVCLRSVLFFGIDLFFDFAGYSNMAMGLGLMLGVEVPRNFRAPFLATDIMDFWDRWHISLSTWLRDFVFMRFSQFAMSRKLFSSRITTACIGFMLNMFLMGVWHGLTWDYVAYGVYHGALLAGCYWMQKKWKFYKKHKRDRWFGIASWAVTMVAVFFGFALFGGYVVTPLLGGAR